MFDDILSSGFREGLFDDLIFQIRNQYSDIKYEEASGISLIELQDHANQLLEINHHEPHIIQKAMVFALILDKSQLAVDPWDWFVDKINHGNILKKIRTSWYSQVMSRIGLDEKIENGAFSKSGSFDVQLDTGHTSPGWDTLLVYGPAGINEMAVDKIRNGSQLSEPVYNFYKAVSIVYQAVCRLLSRMSMQAKSTALRYPEYKNRMLYVAYSLDNIAHRAPKTFHEALQLTYIFHELQEMEGENVRAMGGFDRLYINYLRYDLENSKLTNTQAKEFIKYFFMKFYAKTRDRENGKNIMFGGQDRDGNSCINELSYLAIDAYQELSIPNPKLSIRVHDDMPDDFLEKVASCIRSGNSSIVYANDNVTISTMINRGKTLPDARDYLLIGCYEPAVMGKEISCSMAITINLAKAVELAINNGIDPLTGNFIGIQTGLIEEFTSFDDFFLAYKKQLQYQLELAMGFVKEYEAIWFEVNPSPLLSGTVQDCFAKGLDVSEGGARYNNSGCTCAGFASAIDSLNAIKQFVFEDKLVSLSDLSTMLKQNWKGRDILRKTIQNSTEKWGNNSHETDILAYQIAKHIASVVNTKPNNRGGLFSSALFSIDLFMKYGRKTGALPDGRMEKQPLSKNLNAMTGLDRNGVTALIESVGKIDFKDFPNGAVLDISLHPSAVSNTDGLDVISTLMKVFFAKGGLSIQFNVLDSKILKLAQKYPEQYATLQVRVCGWNAYFINLNKEEQDEFIRQAEHL